MSLHVPDNVHIIPLGVEYDRVIRPPIDANADRVVLLSYLPEVLQRQVKDEDIRQKLSEHGITVSSSDVRIDDLFDAVAVFGRVLRAHVDGRV